MSDQTHTKKHLFFPIISILLLGVIVYGGVKYQTLQKLNDTQKTDITLLQEKIVAYNADIEKREVEKNDLTNALLAEQDKVNSIGEEFNKVADTVNNLEKLSKTDKELLQKYSKVSFLNEHYVPEDLSKINKAYIWNKQIPLEIHSKVEPFLDDMLEEAESDGINLLALSAYRSFASQKALKSTYAVTYGSGANAFSADQGYSEHQLGTTLDFTTKELGASFSSFEATEAYKWLEDNAHLFGFVLSYPKGNKYYIFEPWHWRFVGKKLAKKLHREDKFFYDMDQRSIDEYLINIFD